MNCDQSHTQEGVRGAGRTWAFRKLMKTIPTNAIQKWSCTCPHSPPHEFISRLHCRSLNRAISLPSTATATHTQTNAQSTHRVLKQAPSSVREPRHEAMRHCARKQERRPLEVPHGLERRRDRDAVVAHGHELAQVHARRVELTDEREREQRHADCLRERRDVADQDHDVVHDDARRLDIESVKHVVPQVVRKVTCVSEQPRVCGRVSRLLRSSGQSSLQDGWCVAKRCACCQPVSQSVCTCGDRSRHELGVRRAVHVVALDRVVARKRVDRKERRERRVEHRHERVRPEQLAAGRERAVRLHARPHERHDCDAHECERL